MDDSTTDNRLLTTYSQYNKYDVNYIQEPFSLLNSGVNCWLNTLLQCLLSCPSFNKIIITSMEQREIKNHPFLQVYLKLYKTHSPECSQEALNILCHMAERKITKAMAKYVSEMHDRQYCVDEALHEILDYINYLPLKNLFLVRSKKYIECKKCNKLVCEKQDEAITIDCNISRDMPKTSEEFSDYLKINISQTADYRCDYCKEVISNNINGNFVDVLTRVGEIVIVRFTDKYYNGMKYPIWYPQVLSFSGKQTKFNYRLVAQVLHHGTNNGGHYTSVVSRYSENNIKNTYHISDMQKQQFNPI